MRQWSPARALAHPLWIASLALLGLNDHVLKRLVPGVATGKLSDFAGLFVAPALFAAVLRVRRPRAILACHVAVALVFALVKTIPAVARAYASLSSLLFPSSVVCDPTDLLALPMVWAAWRVLTPWMVAPPHGFVERAAIAAGMILCIATPDDPPPEVFLTVVNASSRARAVSVASLRGDLKPDPSAQSSLEKWLTRGAFQAAPSVQVPSGWSLPPEQLILDKIHYRWIEAEGLPPALIATNGGDTLEVRITDAGYTVTSGLKLMVDPAPPADPFSGCRAPDEKMARAIGRALSGLVFIDAARPNAEGCLEIDHSSRTEVSTMTLCIPDGMWPFADGEVVTIDRTEGYATIVHNERAELVVWRGVSIPESGQFPTMKLAELGCKGTAGACGMIYENDALVVEGSSRYVGTTSTLADGSTLYVAQAGTKLIVNACAYTNSLSRDIGFVLLRK